MALNHLTKVDIEIVASDSKYRSPLGTTMQKCLLAQKVLRKAEW